MRRFSFALLVFFVTLPLAAATEPNPTKRQRELVLKLLEVTNSGDTAKAMVDAMIGQVEGQFAGEEGDSSSEVSSEVQEMLSAFREELGKMDLIEPVREAYVRLFSRYFTEQELQDVINFYESPTGKKTIQVLPAVTRDAVEMGATHLSPLIDEAMKKAMARVEAKRPWRRTMSDLRTVGVAVEAYAVDNERYPAGDYSSLQAALVPTYIKELPEKDIWGTAYAYVVSPDGQHYRLVSAGADSDFEWDSQRINVVKEGEMVEIQYRERLQDDLIFADGEFIQLPVQARAE